MSQIASRQIAIATVIEACKRRQRLGNQYARLPIHVLGDTFWVGPEQFTGFAVLTADALFLVKLRPVRSAGSKAGLPPEVAPLLEMRHADVPGILADDAAWPVGLSGDTDVCVLMRQQLDELVTARHEIQFLSNSAPIRVGSGDLDRAIHILQNTGWLRATPNAQRPPVAMRPRAVPPRDLRPAVVGLLCASVLIAIALITRIDLISTTLAMLLCVPVLTGAVFAIGRLLAQRPKSPPDHSSDHLG